MATKGKADKNSSKTPLEKVLGSRKKQENRRKADDFKQYYCNNSSLVFSVWDTAITFGQVDRTAQGELGGFIEQCDIIMSHAHFKAFVNILSQNLAAIEKKYGEIQILDLESKDNTDEISE